VFLFILYLKVSTQSISSVNLMEPAFELRETDYWNKFVKPDQLRAGPSPAAAPAVRSLRSGDIVFEIPQNCYWNAFCDETESSIKVWSTPIGSSEPEKNVQLPNCEQAWSDGSSLVWERFLAVEEGPPLDIDDLVNEIGADCEEKKESGIEDQRVDQDGLDDFSLSDLTETILNFLSADQTETEHFTDGFGGASMGTEDDNPTI